MTKIKRITLEFRDRFHEPVELNFADHLTVIVGPNGSGKSTILEATAEVMPFLHQYSIEGPASSVREMIKTGRTYAPDWVNATVEIEIDSAIINDLPSSISSLFNDRESDLKTVSPAITRRQVKNEERWVVESIDGD